jgi:hypothetical protein
VKAGGGTTIPSEGSIKAPLTARRQVLPSGEYLVMGDIWESRRQGTPI